MKDLHIRIRRWREAAGLRQIDLARLLGVSPAAVSLWEAAGKNQPSTRNVERIAKACGVSLRIFFGELPPDPEPTDPGTEAPVDEDPEPRDAAAI